MAAPEGFPQQTEIRRTVSEDQVKATYARLRWREIDQAQQIGMGEANVIMMVKTNDQELEIVKICPNGEERVRKAKKAAWCAERANAMGIPTNKVKSVTEEDPDLGLFVVEEFLEGESPDFNNLQACLELTKVLGGYLNKLHEFKVAGAGEIDENGRGMTESWPEHVRNWIRYIEEELANNPDAGKFIPQGLVETTLRQLRKFSWLPANEHSLLHGDPTLYNTLVKEDGTLVILDWDNALAGDPMFDLAYFEYVHVEGEHGQRAYRRALRSSYGLEPGPGGSNDEMRIEYYQKLLALSAVNWYLKRGNYDKFQEAVLKLQLPSRLLDEFQ